MTSPDAARDELYRLLQTIYFDSIDQGDAAAAVDAFDEDVEWVHTQVWEHDGHDRSQTDTLRGRASVREFLAARISEMRVEGIQHRLRQVIADGRLGAFRAEVVGPTGTYRPFLGWVELTDGKISTYIVTPER
jgi:ketosteroid isomerase-like protein